MDLAARLFRLPVLLLAGWLAACSGPPVVKAPDPDPVPSAEEKLPEHVGINVYLDASLSMQGFATAEGSSTTAFAQTLEHFDSSRLLLPGSELDFYRFGAQGGAPGQPTVPTMELIANRDFRQAFRRPFYADPHFRADNFLDQVVKKAPLRTFGIIVSDLFQADSDIAQLSESLQDRLAAGADIALLAMESPFKGTVYDIGSQKIKLDYTGPRPFFGLLYGQPAAVRAYGEGFRADLEKDAVACHLLRFSTEVVKQPLSFAHSTPRDLVNVDLVTLLDVDDPRVAQLRLRPDAGPGTFNCDFPWETVASEMAFDVSSVRSTVTVKRWENGDWKDDAKAAEGIRVEAMAAPPVPPPAPGDDAASPTLAAPATPAMRVAFHFDPAHLPGPAVYRFDCSLGLESVDFHAPDWVGREDMDTSHISEWQRNPALYHGSVLNLRHFVDEVWLETCHRRPPKVGQLYVYLQIPG